MNIDFQNALVFLVFGAAVGGLYFRLLWLAVKSMSAGPNPWKTGVIGMAARLTVLVLSFAALVIFIDGAMDIIFWLIGFLIVRSIAVARIKSSVKSNAKPGV